MLCNALTKFVAAIDDSAIATFIESFSASRLKGLDFCFPLSFSFFFLSLEALEKNEPEPDEDFVWLKDWTVCAGCG